MSLLRNDLEKMLDESCILHALIQKSGIMRIIYDAYGVEHIKLKINEDIYRIQQKYLFGFFYEYDGPNVVIKLLDYRTSEYSVGHYNLHVNLNDILNNFV